MQAATTQWELDASLNPRRVRLHAAVVAVWLGLVDGIDFFMVGGEEG